jgi:hypothetical protein
MGNRCSTLTADISPAAESEITLPEQSPLVHANPARVSASERPIRSRVKSAPQKVPNREDLPPSPAQRSRAKSAPQKVQPMKTGKGSKPLTPQKSTADAAPQKVQTMKDSTPSLAQRFRAKSAPHKVHSIKDGVKAMSDQLGAEPPRAKAKRVSAIRHES